MSEGQDSGRAHASRNADYRRGWHDGYNREMREGFFGSPEEYSSYSSGWRHGLEQREKEEEEARGLRRIVIGSLALYGLGLTIIAMYFAALA